MLKKITVDGCDDSTHVIIDVPPECVAFVEKLAADITEASTYGCMPRMTIEDARDADR